MNNPQHASRSTVNATAGQVFDPSPNSSFDGAEAGVWPESGSEAAGPDVTAAGQLELPRVGLPSGQLPGAEAAAGQGGAGGQEAKGEQTSQWWAGASVPVPPVGGPGSKTPGWGTSAAEELGRFRHLPVVGRFSWKSQYAIAAGILLLPLLILAVLAFMLARQTEQANAQATADLALRQAIQSVTAWKDDASAEGSEALRLNGFLTQGRAAIDDLSGSLVPAQQLAWTDIQAKWRTLEDAIRLRTERGVAFQGFAAASVDLSSRLLELASRMQASLQATGAETGGALGQTMADLRDWQEVSAQLSVEGMGFPERLLLERQRIEQQLRAFASSPEAQVPGGATEAWRALAGSWTQIQPLMDGLLAQRELSGGGGLDAQGMGQQIDGIHQALNALAATAMAWQANRAGLWQAAWIAGLLTVGALVLVCVVGWNQLRYQSLETRLAQEQIELQVNELMADLKEVEAGNLSHRGKTGASRPGDLSEAFHHAFDRLRRVIARVKRAIEDTAETALLATASSGALIDEIRRRSQVQDGHGTLITEIAERSRHRDRGAGQLGTLAAEAAVLLGRGTGEAVAVKESFQEARTRLDEMGVRTRRMATTTGDTERTAEWVAELAEEVEVLSIQASVLAAKAGERGLPFERVAKGLKTVSEHLTQAATRAGGQVKTALADTEALSEALVASLSDIDEGARLYDVAQESWALMDAQIQALQRQASSVQPGVETWMGPLEESVRQEQMQAASALKLAQHAADTAVSLGGAVATLNDAAQKIRV